MTFRYNRRTGRMEKVEPERPQPHSIFLKMKRVYFETLNREKVTDQELREVIKKVDTGTRNSHYLQFPNHQNTRSLQEVIYGILREYN